MTLLNTGRSESIKVNRKPITVGLLQLLATTYSLYLKTQNFHWNVTGPIFNMLYSSHMNSRFDTNKLIGMIVT